MTLRLLNIPIGDICASPTNPRRTFEPTCIDELAEDIKARGVLSPVLVRPRSDAMGYELVFGECRWRAAKEAGLAEIPAMVRELSDAEVLEIQVVENAKRRDVHPLEEADAYRALHEVHGYSIDDIAAKLGKSKSYVYQRIRLCGLCEPAREAFFAGRLKPAVALMLARIEDPDVQARAAEDVADRPWPASDLWKHIQHSFLHRLAKAPFDIEDAKLVKGVGSCAKCPHRTGNQAELFEDVAEEDSCTKESCWDAKSDAAWVKRSKGAKVLSDEELEEHVPYGNLAYRAPFIDLNGTTYVGGKHVPWREVLEDTNHQVTLARTKSGKVLELVAKEVAQRAAAKLDTLPPKTPEQERKKSEWEEKRAKEEAERKAKEEARNAKVADLIERIEKAGPCAAILRAIVKCNASYYVDEARRRRGLEGEEAFAVELAVMNEAELVGLLAEIAIEHAEDIAGDDDEDPFAILEAALEAAPKGKRNLKKREAK